MSITGEDMVSGMHEAWKERLETCLDILNC